MIEVLQEIFLNKRMKSLYWRIGAMVFAELGAIVPVVLADYHAPQYVVIVIGLVLAEVTKAMNTPK